MRPRLAIVPLAIAAVLALAPSPASAAPPRARAGGALGPPPSALRHISAADRRDWRRAIAIADRTRSVRSQRRRYPGLRSTFFAREGRCCMTVWYTTNGKYRAVVKADLHTGAIIQQWAGWQ